MKKYRGLSLKKGYIWKFFLTGFYFICKFFLIYFLNFSLYLFLYTACIFLKQVGGVKKFLPEKMISLGGGGLF